MDCCRVILPTPQDRSGLTLTRGTTIVTPMGEKIEGVTKLVLIAETNDIWRAELHLFVHAPDISCLSTFEYKEFRTPWWQRLRNMLWPGMQP